MFVTVAKKQKWKTTITKYFHNTTQNLEAFQSFETSYIRNPYKQFLNVSTCCFLQTAHTTCNSLTSFEIWRSELWFSSGDVRKDNSDNKWEAWHFQLGILRCRCSTFKGRSRIRIWPTGTRSWESTDQRSRAVWLPTKLMVSLVVALILANIKYFKWCLSTMYQWNMLNNIFFLSWIQRIWRSRREASTLGKRKDFRSTLFPQPMERTLLRSKARFVLLSPLSGLQWFQMRSTAYHLKRWFVLTWAELCFLKSPPPVSVCWQFLSEIPHRCLERWSRERWTTSKTPATSWMKSCRNWRYDAPRPKKK